MEKVFIGVDVSKLTLDLFVKSNKLEQHYQIKNEVKAISKFIKSFEDQSNIIIAMENTGRYNFALYEVLASTKIAVYVINALHLKRSFGLVRGKNDRIDSQRICTFIERNFMDLELWNAGSIEIQKLSLLNAERRHRVKIRTGLQIQTKDAEQLKNIADKDVIEQNKQLILFLDELIKSIEGKILELINSNEQLRSQYKRIQTIPGVGKVLATLMIIKTKGFSDIKSARKMACYAGVAPFEYSSGSSIFRKLRVSTIADKELKKVLHLAALSTIRLNNDLAEYYKRKVEQGKNKMSVINAIRNKIIHRIYALIKNEAVYNFSLHMS